MKPDLSPIFYNCGEIRMGSPYNVCHLKLVGDWLPVLPDYDWQDKFAYNNDKSILALIRWKTDNNTPGFVVVTIDTNARTVTESKRYLGCCDKIEWSEKKFEVVAT